ncbi:MAG: lysine--tRNA ligase [Candidatus Saccharibacteria bacterium]|nr:lysine--tRNA ligase [Candidatus Saccharibacteria bacterium]
MQWLNKIADELTQAHPEGELLIESGIAPSGSYHMGYLREIITCDALLRELRKRGRRVRHVHFVDDLDGFRKVPSSVPAEYERYLGMPLCDLPAPDGSQRSYADFALQSFLDSVARLGIEFDMLRAHEKYRAGFFVPAIERVLESIDETRRVLEDVSGRTLDQQWSPIQVNEGGYLKKRPFVGIDVDKKIIRYLDKDGNEQATSYQSGEVKLDWRVDWPARWWLLGVQVEPFGRDHGSKGGSYDTGRALMDRVFQAPAPYPIPYDFVNRAGDTKKMSASSGNGILMSEVVEVLPPEVSRYFILRMAPSRALFFDPQGGVVRLIDEFAQLLAKPNKDEGEEQLVGLCTEGIEQITVSSVPFSHLVASYQASLGDAEKTLDVIARTEHKAHVQQQRDTIIAELKFIDKWLATWAPEEVKFSLAETVDEQAFSPKQRDFMNQLADKISAAPGDADGEWFHKAIYEFKEYTDVPPKELFATLYRALINKSSGPRAGWFLSILPREWLIARLRLEE